MSKKVLCDLSAGVLLVISLFGFLIYIIPRKLAAKTSLPILPTYVPDIADVLFVLAVILLFMGTFLGKSTPAQRSSNASRAAENNSISEPDSGVCSRCGGLGYTWDFPGDCPACGGTGKSS